MMAKTRVRKKKVEEPINLVAPPPLTSNRMEILAKASELTSGSRNESYGSPQPNMECFAALQMAFNQGIGAKGGSMPGGVYAAVIHCLNKISRIAANPSHMDNYTDLAAYAGIGGECASTAFGVPC